MVIPLDPEAKAPAADLVYRGRPVDGTEAAGLRRQGVELWRLNPYESQLWKDAPAPEEDHRYPLDGATVRFDSYLASTQGIFRSSVDGIDPAARAGSVAGAQVRPFTLSVSLSNPAALMRAVLLRKIGYRNAVPRLYRRLTIEFADKATRDQFLDNLADRSLTSRKRWIQGELDDRPQVTLQGVVLEPGRIDAQTVHWGLMRQPTQAERRVFRALIVPDVLCDFLEKVNSFAWDPSRLFNGAINFDYLFSDGFADVTIDDARWIMARIAALGRPDFQQMVAAAGLPQDVGALVVEKLVSRRNALVKAMNLTERPLLGYDSDVTLGNVSRGQLMRDNYTGYPQEFYKKPDLPPLRFSQLWRYGAIEGISAGISALLNQVNSRLLTVQSSGTAMSEHQKDVSKGIAKYLFKTGSLSGFQQNAGVWGSPLAGANLSASRTVVAGTYLGSDSQVQLVDTMSVSVNAGFFIGWDGMSPVLSPSVGSTVTVSRTYAHVKPVQDMDKALKTNWANIVTAGFMMHLSRSLNPDIQCTIPEGPWTSEFEIDGTKFTKINYDQHRPGGKEEALAYRDKLIAQGTSPDRILLQANDRKEDCKASVEKAVDKNLADFADGLAVGDTFIITDSVQMGASETLRVPITTLAGIDLSVTASADQGYQIQRQTMLRKTASGFQVYLTDSKMDSLGVGLDLNFYISIFKMSRERRHGHADTDYYSIDTDKADVETKQNLIRSIKALLRANNAEVLTDHFQPYTLKQDILARITRFKLLFWNLANGIQDLAVDIYPPVDPKLKRNRGDYKRTLSMNRMVTQKGKDIFGFMVGVVGDLTGGLVAMPGVGSGTDPGNSPAGKSWTGSIATQAETTPGAPWRPVTAMQQVYRGWKISRADVFEIFSRIENAYGPILTTRAPFARGLFDRTQFNNTSQLELYQIDTTLIFYPEALETVKNWVMSSDSRASTRWLQYLSGNKKRGWIDKVLKMRAQGLPPSTDREAQLRWYNSLMSYVVNNADIRIFLSRLDQSQYFFVTRVNGFRKNNATGALDGYLSDTVGHYDSEKGLGIFRDISAQYGISLFHLYAQYFTDGL